MTTRHNSRPRSKTLNHKRPRLVPTADRLAFKASEAALMLGLDRGAVYDLLRTGRLRFTRLAGGTMIIPRTAIDEYLSRPA